MGRKQQPTEDRKVENVYFNAAAWLADPEFILFDAAERGVYLTIILFLYTGNGKFKYDANKIKRLSNWPPGCRKTFKVGLQEVLLKFQVRRGWITHKRVTAELKRAQTARLQRVNAANARWGKDADAMRPQSDRTSGEIEGKEGRKEREKERIEVELFRRFESIERVIPPKTKSDTTILNRIIRHLINQVQNGSLNGDTWDKVLAIAELSKSKKRPFAYFQTSIRDHYGDGFLVTK